MQINSLTSLRGVAAIWIVLHHFWPQTNDPTPYLITKGYLAVDLFFILSGIVLYLMYADQIRTSQFDVKRFAYKRFARLYPVHLVTLLLAMLILNIGPALGIEGRAPTYDFGQMFLLHLTLLHAWGITQTGGLNYPSWSLAAEAFAYLLFPLLTYITLKRRYALTVNLIILISCMLLAQLFWPAALRHSTDSMVFTRLENDFGTLRIIPEFLLGLAIAKHAQTAENGAFFHIIAAPLMGIGLILNFDAFTVLGLAALLAGCVITNPKTPLLFQHIGALSYSLYMSHALVQIVGFKLIEITFQYQDGAVPVVFLLPLLILTILCAQALHHGCERPARRWLLSLAVSKSAVPKDVRSCPM